MRSVAKFRLVHDASDTSLFNQVESALRTWFESKVECLPGGAYQTRRNQKPITAAVGRHDLERAKLFRMNIAEPVDGGILHTTVALMMRGEQVRFITELGVLSSGVQRPRLALKAPRFIQTVASLGPEWRVDSGRDRVFSHPFRVTQGESEAFIDLLLSKFRMLAVIAISEYNGEQEFPELANSLAVGVAGLAHVCTLEDAASWSLTQRLGVQWSCYNGAVRIYWPGGVGVGQPFSHALWCADRLKERFGHDGAGRWLQETITARVIEASSYLAADSHFEEIERERSDARIEAAKNSAAGSSDYRELAEIYADENDRLREKTARLISQLENAEAELAGLRRLYLSGQVSLPAADESEEEAPPSTVAEAVSIAQARLSDRLRFSEDIGRQIETLHPSAGPPQKIYDYLSVLASLSAELTEKDGSIGKSIPTWLRQRGVVCSGESETKKASKAERDARTFSVDGDKLYCELHLKPSDGVSPDRCVRIYFARRNEEPAIGIGYIGRHF